MPWTVIQADAASLQRVLNDVEAKGLEVAHVLLQGPMLRDLQGKMFAAASYLVLVKAAGVAQPAAAAPVNELAVLPERLQVLLCKEGLTTRAAVAGAWPEEVAKIVGISMADGLAIQQFLGPAGALNAMADEVEAIYAAEEAEQEEEAPPPEAPPEPPRSSVIVLPGFEGMPTVPQGYTGSRPQQELPPHLQAASNLENNPLVRHRDSVVLKPHRFSADKDGVGDIIGGTRE